MAKRKGEFVKSDKGEIKKIGKPIPLSGVGLPINAQTDYSILNLELRAKCSIVSTVLDGGQ